MDQIMNVLWADFHQMFPLPSRMIETRGTQEGMILKFKTFYLKIYDDGVEDSYVVQGFRYKEKRPVFVETITSYQFRAFARKFTKEDYLVGFEEPCDDPECLLLVHQNRTYES
jgi:hypothetical protein